VETSSSLILPDLFRMGCVLVYVSLVILIPKTLKNRNIISRGTARKIVHSMAGLSVFITPYLNYPVLAALLAGGMTVMTRKSSRNSRTSAFRELYEAIHEDEESELGYLQGPFAYSAAITILVFVFLFFPEKFYFPIAAILVMMFADPTASIVGKKFGKHFVPIPWTRGKRTLEGSAAFFLVALACSLFTFLFLGNLLPGHSDVLSLELILFFSLLMSVVSTLIELLSPSKYDDFFVPIGATAFVSAAALLLGI